MSGRSFLLASAAPGCRTPSPGTVFASMGTWLTMMSVCSLALLIGPKTKDTKSKWGKVKFSCKESGWAYFDLFCSDGTNRYKCL